MKVLVLGAGKMTSAILTGLKKTENLSEWMIYSPTGVSAKKLAVTVGAQFVSDLNEVKNVDWILIGCKPQQLTDLKTTLAGRFQDILHLSLLAALSEEHQREILGAKQMIRVMPNLPVEVNTGITLLSSESSPGRLDSFQKLFQKLGMALVLKESELDELTLLTGSGPAFYYEFTKNLLDSFESLSESEREKLAKFVVMGAGKALTSTQNNLTEMTNAVTSKGGVTIAVLEAWRNKNLASLIKEGILAGKKRTEEIRTILRN